MEEEKQAGESYKNVARPLRKILFYNFLGGVAWSAGTLIGLGTAATIIGYVLSRVDLIPIIGSWVAEIVKYVTSSSQLPNTRIR